jgi:uncharacterized membrane protein
MLKFLAAYGAAALVFLLLDVTWLSVVSEAIYRPEVGAILADNVFMPAAVAFYLIYVGGMVVLAAYPGYRDGSIATAAVTGAVLGLVAYGTYDLTNLATLKLWSLKVTVIDMAWGTFVTAASSAAACAAMIAVGGRDDNA